MNKWTATGLPHELLSEPPTVEKTFKLAVRETHVGLEYTLVRLAKDDDESIVSGVVREETHDDCTLAYHKEARVLVDMIAAVFASDAPGHEASLAIQSRLGQHCNEHTPD